MIDVIKAALEAAKVSIQIDRTSLADSSMRADNTMEPEGASGVAEYDAVLAKLDVALSTLQAQPTPTEHIKEPYTLAELNERIASNDYNAELLLQHAMLLLNAQPVEVSDEPTEAQIAAGMRELFAGPKPWPSWEVTLKRVYQAMFALRPQAVPMTDEQDAYKQTEGSKNCMQCAAAYMLGLPLAEVPDFEQAGPQAWESFYEFFEGRGFTAEMFPPSVEIEGDYLASGDTERGTSHMVVMRGGKLLHDPHPSNAGLKSVQVVWLIARRSVCITAPAGGEKQA